MTDTMDIRDKLTAKRAAVDAELARILTGEPAGMYEVMRYAVGGGKRFRPLLLLAVGEALGAQRSLILPYACAVELIHSYSLVHDDLPAMDNDDVRRGKPSCHKAFGEGRALLAGDGLLTLAFEVLSRTPFDPALCSRKERACREIASAAGAEGMIKGQWLDITLAPGNPGEEAFLDLIRRKTGALIRASAVAGAVLAGAPEAALRAVDDFGESVGLAFQVRDDILDAGPSPPPTEPNAVAVFGRDGARSRLDTAVDSALRALEALPVDTGELRYLAGTLRLESGFLS